MTKSLTEKWKDGKLEKIQYYVRLKNGRICRCLHIGSPNWMRGIDGLDEIVQEVLAPVPSYDKYKELKDFKQKAIDDSTTNPMDCMQIEINGLNEYIKKLQEQLKEANEVILGLHKPYGTSLEPATIYLDKWGVK